MPRGRVSASVALCLGLASGLWLGCGDKPAPPPPPPPAVPDARPADAGAALTIDELPLGAADLAAFGWRRRAGQRAFRQARIAEGREDWARVVTLCTQALAADPGHLDAAWLIAIGFAELGQLDRVLAPLRQAAAGDFAKWGPASLEHPALAAFLATPTGEAWRRRVELDRARYAAALARALIVTADGDLYGVEVDTGRWHRLTRTVGAVLGALEAPAARQIAYVARVKRAGKRELGIGTIDLARGRGSRPVPVGSAGPIAVAYSAQPPIGFWVATGGPRAIAWRQFDDEYHFHALAKATPRPPGAWLEITGKLSVRVHALPSNVTADWDEQSLASAIRIGSSNRIVSVPSPGLIDGNTAAWSPDRVHLAFVAQLDDHCAAGAVNTAVFVADAATGGARELERSASGIAVTWLAERRLAVAGDHGVTVRSLDDGVAPVAIAGATGLMSPRERPRCAPVSAADAPAADGEPAGDDGEPVDPTGAEPAH
ncbi:MAG TPA: hypothetical protein VFP84_23165 [Kofleriaceae bacterium]|nr:hypothetical protein [Kofleriaceae bacterium]